MSASTMVNEMPLEYRSRKAPNFRLAVLTAALLLPSSAMAKTSELEPVALTAPSLGQAKVLEPESAMASGDGMTVSTDSGDAPLNVVFTIQISGRSYFGGVWIQFGDGQKAMVCRPGSGCYAELISHTYERHGSYVALFVGVGEGGEDILGTVGIVVNDRAGQQAY